MKMTKLHLVGKRSLFSTKMSQKDFIMFFLEFTVMFCFDQQLSLLLLWLAAARPCPMGKSSRPKYSPLTAAYTRVAHWKMYGVLYIAHISIKRDIKTRASYSFVPAYCRLHSCCTLENARCIAHISIKRGIKTRASYSLQNFFSEI